MVRPLAFRALLASLLFSVVGSLLLCDGARAQCPAPVVVEAYTTTDTSAIVIWKAVDEALGYELAYRSVHDTSMAWTTVNITTPVIKDTLTGLAPSTFYEMQIRAVCSGALSDYSPISEFSTGPRRTPPVFSHLSSLSNTAILTWGPSLTATEYILDYRLEGDTVWTTDSTAELYMQLSGLTTNETYEARARAKFDRTGYSEYTRTITFATAPCNAPTGVGLVEGGVTTTKLNWNGPEILGGYEVRYRYPFGSGYEYATVGDTFVTLTNLQSNENYTANVRQICDSALYSAWSSNYSFSTGDCRTPINILVSNVNYTSVRVSWNNAAGAADYQVRYQALGAGNWDTVTTTTPKVDLTGLSAGTSYQYEVRTHCGSNVYSTYSTADTFATLTCDVATTISLDSTTYTTAQLSWTSSVAGAHNYEIRYCLGDPEYWSTWQVNDTSLTLTAQLPGYEYWVQVRAKCADGVYSSWSDTLMFTQPGCPAPDSAWTSNVGYNTFTYTWNSTPGALDYQLLYRRLFSSDTVWYTYETNDTAATFNDLEHGVYYELHAGARCDSSALLLYAAPDTVMTQYCAVPDSIELDSATYATLTLHWASVGDAQYYQIEYKGANDFTWRTDTTSATSITLDSLTATTTYRVYVRSQCDTNVVSAYGQPLEVSTGTCAEPTGLSAMLQGYTQLTATWYAVPTAQRYLLVYQSESSIDSIYTSDTTQAVTGLTPGETYWLAVQSICDTNYHASSAYSAPLEATMPSCGGVSGLTSPASNDTSATLRWSSYANAQRYRLQWRAQGDTSWTTLTLADTTKTLTGLSACTIYESRAASVCDTTQDVTSAYTYIYRFQTTGTGCFLAPLPLTTGYDMLWEKGLFCLSVWRNDRS